MRPRSVSRRVFATLAGLLVVVLLQAVVTACAKRYKQAPMAPPPEQTPTPPPSPQNP